MKDLTDYFVLFRPLIQEKWSAWEQGIELYTEISWWSPMVSVVYDGLGFNPPFTSLVLFILLVCNYVRVGLEEYYVLFCDYIENPN